MRKNRRKNSWTRRVQPTHGAVYRISNLNKHPSIGIIRAISPLKINERHCLLDTIRRAGFAAREFDKTQLAITRLANAPPFRELFHIIVVTYQNCVVRF